LPFTGSNVPELIDLLSPSGAVAQRLRLITNQVGTVEAVVDVNSGSIVQRLEYDEFGRVLLDSNPGLQPFGFGGGLYDWSTSSVRFGARDYVPGLGRWTSRDPIRLAGETNEYIYGQNNPVIWMDPAGLITSKTKACLEVKEAVYEGCLERCPWYNPFCYFSCVEVYREGNRRCAKPPPPPSKPAPCYDEECFVCGPESPNGSHG